MGKPKQDPSWAAWAAKAKADQELTVGGVLPPSERARLRAERDRPYMTVTVDLDALREDIRFALGATGAITSAAPCWKCGSPQPAHNCEPQNQAERRLLAFADASRDGNKPLRTWEP